MRPTLVRELKLDGAKSVSAAGVKPTAPQCECDSCLLVNVRSLFKGIAASANYLSADQPEIQLAGTDGWRSTPISPWLP